MTNNNIGVGVRVQSACGGSAGGYIYPIVILVSWLSDSEMPSDDFIVFPVEGMTINGHIDPRNRELGYACFMKQNVKQIYFFDWFYRTITYPTVQAIRAQFDSFTTNESLTTDNTNKKCVLWGNSYNR